MSNGHPQPYYLSGSRGKSTLSNARVTSTETAEWRKWRQKDSEQQQHVDAVKCTPLSKARATLTATAGQCRRHV